MVVDLTFDGRTIQAPVLVVPGHPENCGTITLGYGRTLAGRTGNGVGFNPYAFRTTSAPWTFDAEIRATGATYPLVRTQMHHRVEGRGVMRVGTMDEFKADPNFVNSHHYEEFSGANPPSIYKADIDLSKGTQWGMVINLNACIGCNACVIACQSENNISIVGKDQVRRNREMHWIRIDHYYEGDPANPTSYHQPLTCMQCENAPCESVCPVAATTHSNDGINQMVYNRCVGTRYCSNNCPYKVRRFNFYKYADHTTPSLKLMRNPDVTVRARGVMEKCTYCTQRISEARITAKKDNREIRDGEVVTACQQSCPTKAITFGNINDAASGVAKLRASPLHYGMLRELNTKPRTTYLARVLNLNPELAAAPTGHGEQAEHGEG
jgi:molybdopterin-containing oxidoreductase family iron-sulfur binding subunit